MDCAQVAVALSLVRFCGLRHLPRLFVEVGHTHTLALPVWGGHKSKQVHVMCADTLRFQLLGSR